MTTRTDVSFTTFLDFAVAHGTGKIAVVRDAQNRPDYHPAFDFYKPLRDAVTRLHRLNQPPDVLDRLNDSPRHNQKRAFEDCTHGYRRWMGRKTFEWLTPVSAVWEHEGLGVRVNPELHLVVEGSPYAIKLFWKDDKPNKRRLDPMLHMMDDVLKSRTDARVGILDVRNAKLYVQTVKKPNLEVLLRAEARSFMSMWTDMAA